jgi:hypothetical protein
MCHVCAEHQDTQVGLETHTCADCCKSFQKKDGVLWRWYDFYPAQGDEAIPVCGACKTLTKHRERMRRDSEDYEREQEEDD